MKKVISGNQAIAEAVKLCKPEVIAAYPITPQSSIMETLSKMIADGELDSELIRVESEHSSMSACIGAQATGSRTFTATSSQGLALMHEMLFVSSGLRLPIVMANVNRSLSSPLNIWNDQSDSYAERDSGWIQLYVENAQEAYDTQIQAFKIAETVRVPVMVCLDGYIVSHTYEPVELLDQKRVNNFLPKYNPEIILNPEKPVTMGSGAGPEYFMGFKKQQQDALEKARKVISEVNEEFYKHSGRKYGNGLVEGINLDKADHVLVVTGSLAGTLRDFIEKENIGILKVKSLRPFPKDEIINSLKGKKAVSLLEKNISLGSHGALYDEVRSALYSLPEKERPIISDFILGLGGRDITTEEIQDIINKTKQGKERVEWVV